MSGIFEDDDDDNETYQVVISNATIISSLRTREVKEMDTIFKNSFSNSARDIIIIAAPIVRLVAGLGNRIAYTHPGTRLSWSTGRRSYKIVRDPVRDI